MIGLSKLRRYSGIAGDRAGVAIVEFALAFPALLVLFIGSYETSNLLLAYQKLEAAAETAADLVGQTPQNIVLQSSGSSSGWDFANITNAVQQVMSPFPTSGLQIAYASITYSTGTAVIDWHTESNGAPAITVGTLPNGVSATTMGTASTGSLDSIIVVQLTYPYTSPLSGFLSTNYTLTESAFNRPRYVSCVPTYLNAGNACP
jgi:Flp pilus assembly protein TadG